MTPGLAHAQPKPCKRVAILQSNYIPWKGYFDLINSVDEFIIFDDMQFTRRDWRNRNKIKTPQGIRWLTIPVQVKGKYFQKIKDTVTVNAQWRHEHWQTIRQNYSRAKYFKVYAQRFEELYLSCNEAHLSRINFLFLTAICQILGIKTRISWSMDYHIVEGKTERLVDLCCQAGTSEYLSGPSAKDYVQEELFHNAGIKLAWMDYSGYPEYEQLYPPFDHYVSILDLLFNQGEHARKFMKSFSIPQTE